MRALLRGVAVVMAVGASSCATLVYGPPREPDAAADAAADASDDRPPCATPCGAACCRAPLGTVRNACSAGVCEPTCAEGFGDCDGDPSNGCEAQLDDDAHCGSCTRPCLGGMTCLPPPPPMMGGPLGCYACGFLNHPCCGADLRCDPGLRCVSRFCVM